MNEINDDDDDSQINESELLFNSRANFPLL